MISLVQYSWGNLFFYFSNQLYFCNWFFDYRHSHYLIAQLIFSMIYYRICLCILTKATCVLGCCTIVSLCCLSSSIKSVWYHSSASSDSCLHSAASCFHSSLYTCILQLVIVLFASAQFPAIPVLQIYSATSHFILFCLISILLLSCWLSFFPSFAKIQSSNWYPFYCLNYHKNKIKTNTLIPLQLNLSALKSLFLTLIVVNKCKFFHLQCGNN